MSAAIHEPPAPVRELSSLRNFLEMIEAGDDIVGSTVKSRALRADLRARIARLEAAATPGGVS